MNISVQMLQRLPRYLNYLKVLPKTAAANISATVIAEALNINDVVVRKDLAAVRCGGKPKIGYVRSALIAALERALGYDDVDDAVIIGVGHLGHALMEYSGFTEYGLNIIAGFDTDKKIIGGNIGGRQIFSCSKIESLCRRMKIRIGIIAVPVQEAQKVCDSLVKGGVVAVWNFAPVELRVPEGILVENENVATSLAMLSRHLSEKIFE